MSSVKWKGWNVFFSEVPGRPSKPRKTDRRFTAHPHFQYYLDLPRTGVYGFHVIRSWAWESWGASKELDDWLLSVDRAENNDCQNPHWCWSSKDGQRRIWLRSPEEVALYRLTYGL